MGIDLTTDLKINFGERERQRESARRENKELIIKSR